MRHSIGGRVFTGTKWTVASLFRPDKDAPVGLCGSSCAGCGACSVGAIPACPSGPDAESALPEGTGALSKVNASAGQGMRRYLDNHCSDHASCAKSVKSSLTMRGVFAVKGCLPWMGVF